MLRTTPPRRADNSGRRLGYALTVGALLGADATALLPLPLEVRLIGAFVIFTALPGWILVRLALRSSPAVGGLEQALLALGAGFTATMLVGLSLLATTRPIEAWHVALAGNVAVVALLSLAARLRVSLGIRLEAPGLPLLCVTGVAAALRLADIAWSEFQGDEARVLLRAMAALQGQADALIAHRKVPGEILTALVYYGHLGAMTELTGRLPFVLAAVAGVMAFFVLGREMLGSRAALVAGLLLAVNGYSVAFGRILQYESLAFLLGSLGLLCCVRFGRGDEPQNGLAFLGGLLLFSAGLVALGALFFVVPAAILVGPRLVAQARQRPVLLLLWGWPALLALVAAVAAVSVEMVTRREGGVLSYLVPRLGGDRPYWNWGLFITSANHYLSTPYLAVMLLGGSAAVVQALIQRLREPPARAAALAIGLALLAAGASWQRPTAAVAVAAGFGVALLAIWRELSTAWRAAFVWAAIPLLTHAVLIRFPGTHWREAFPGLALIVANLVVTALPARLPSSVAAACLGLFVLGIAHYVWVGSVQRWPEYQMTFPADRHPLDWSASSGRGIGGVFGAVHHHGWKALATLQENGLVSGSYATNESPAIAAWYLRRPQGCPSPPAVVIRVPRAPQDRNLSGPVPLPAGYTSAGRLTVAGHATINITAAAARPLSPTPIMAEDWEAGFDSAMTSPWRPIGALYLPDLGAAAAVGECASSR